MARRAQGRAAPGRDGEEPGRPSPENSRTRPGGFHPRRFGRRSVTSLAASRRRTRKGFWGRAYGRAAKARFDCARPATIEAEKATFRW